MKTETEQTGTYVVADNEYRERIKELCVEMVKVALKDIKKGWEYKDIPISELRSQTYKQYMVMNYNSAVGWLEDENRSFLSFQWCCGFLKMSPEKIRNGIMEKIGGKLNGQEHQL